MKFHSREERERSDLGGGKYPSQEMVHEFESRNQPLQNLGVRLPTKNLSHTQQKHDPLNKTLFSLSKLTQVLYCISLALRYQSCLIH